MARPLFDIESRELIFGPPRRILREVDFEPYQRWMSSVAIEQPYVYLAAEMGLGKTGASLFAATQWLQRGIVKKPLIVAPLYVANHTWPDEIATWDFARGLRYSVITGDEEQRLWAAKRPADVYIVNRENLRWLYRNFIALKFGWDAMIYDEASRMKGGSLKTKPVERKDGSVSDPKLSEYGALLRMRHRFKRALLLSGTPTPNGLEDLWGPLRFMDGGFRLGKTKTSFYERWFQYNQWTREYRAFPSAYGEIMGRIKDVFFALKSDDYLALPPLIIKDRWVKLDSSVMEKYRRLEREMLLAEYDVEAVSRGVLINKLLQLSNGSLYREDEEPVRLHDAKLDVLDSIVSEAGGKPLLVAYSFEFDKEAIKRRFKYARVFGEGKNDVADWNEGRIKMMLLHPASAGHGLNFQHGSNIAVWYGLNFSLELYLQFIKRLHRRGQKESRVFMYRILAKDTADARVVEVLDLKEATQQDIMDAVRVRV
jgi:SNF2 family DNA or RNA helicase